MSLRLLMYGPNDIGLRKLVSGASKPFGLCFHEFRGSSFYDHAVINNQDELKNALDKIYYEKYETIVIDNLGSMEFYFTNLISDTGCLYDMGYGVGESKLRYHVSRLLGTIRTMQKDVILLAHEDQRSVPGVTDMVPVPYRVPCVHKCLMEVLLNWVDAVIPCIYSTREIDGNRFTVKQAWITGSPTWMGGCVWESASVDTSKPLPLEWDVMRETFNKLQCETTTNTNSHQ